MLNLSGIHTLSTAILKIVAYAVSATVIGVSQTYINKWLGDSTAEEEGYATLNPIIHIDFVGLFVMLITGFFGWVGAVPFDPSFVRAPLRTIKVLLMHLATPLLSMLIALVSLILIVAFFPYALAGTISMPETTASVCAGFLIAHASQTGLSIALSNILFALVAFNLGLSVISFVFGMVRFALFIGVERGYRYVEYTNYLIFFTLIIFILFFYDTLRSVFFWSIVISAYTIARLIGAC